MEMSLTTDIAGAVTHPNVDVVPDAEFDCNAANDACDKWVAVMDFYGVDAVDPESVHIPVFLRVNDRTWEDGPPPLQGGANQTRIGSFVYGDEVDPDVGQHCDNATGAPRDAGALQITGDDITNPSNGEQVVLCFSIPENPWDNTTTLYRVAIHEERVWSLLTGWRTRWMAEFVDVDAVESLADSGWVYEATIENTYGIDIPAQTNSKLMFGFGPGDAGRADAERTGTSYFVYD